MSSSDASLPPCSSASSPVSSAQIVDLGTHTLEMTCEQGIELSDSTVAVQLNPDETYRLFLALQALFAA